MQTLYELQLVAEMDRQTIELLLPFVCIKTVEGPSRYPSLKTGIEVCRARSIDTSGYPFIYPQGI